MVSTLVSEAHEMEHKALAEELGIADSIIWIAPHALEDLPSCLALADITVAPRPECAGHAVKLPNYMLASNPIVCFAAAAKGVRHMHDAYSVPNHDCEAFGQGITTLLRDRALAAELARNGHAIVLKDSIGELSAARLGAFTTSSWARRRKSPARRAKPLHRSIVRPQPFRRAQLCFSSSRPRPSPVGARPSLALEHVSPRQMPQRNYESDYF